MTPALNHLPVVAINSSRRDAESLVEALQRAQLGATRLSIVGKGFRTEEHVIGLYASRDRARWRGARGSVATLQSAEVGALAADLAQLGVPEVRALQHEIEVKAGRYLVLALVPAALVEKARWTAELPSPCGAG
jgi:hypothetical protein